MRVKLPTPVQHHPCPRCYQDGAVRLSDRSETHHTLRCTNGHSWVATTQQIIAHTAWLNRTSMVQRPGIARSGDR